MLGTTAVSTGLTVRTGAREVQVLGSLVAHRTEETTRQSADHDEGAGDGRSPHSLLYWSGYRSERISAHLEGPRRAPIVRSAADWR